jgi:hypothetical protein
MVIQHLGIHTVVLDLLVVLDRHFGGVESSNLAVLSS